MGTETKILRKRLKREDVEKLSSYYKASMEHLYKRKMDTSRRNEKIIELKYEVIGLVCPPLLIRLILSKISFEGNEVNMEGLVNSTIEVKIY